jgi:hypothetical protein
VDIRGSVIFDARCPPPSPTGGPIFNADQAVAVWWGA